MLKEIEKRAEVLATLACAERHRGQLNRIRGAAIDLLLAITKQKRVDVIDTLVVRIEEGCLSYESHSGDWMTETGLNYLTSVFDDEIGPLLDMEPEAEAAIKVAKENPSRVFLVTINDPCWAFDGGYWDMNYGYVDPESHLEWNSSVEVKEL